MCSKMESETVSSFGPPTETVKLKNGTEEAVPLVAIVMFSLEKFLETKPIVLYELCECCRDLEHEPWGQSGPDLVKLNLVDKTPDGYQVHGSIRNIVLSAIKGDGADMVLVDPRA